MTSSSRVRPLQADDRARWDELWAGYLEFYQQTLPQSTTDFTWRRLMEGRELWGFAGVDDGGRMVGFAHYHIHLSTWSVQPATAISKICSSIRKAAAGTSVVR